MSILKIEDCESLLPVWLAREFCGTIIDFKYSRFLCFSAAVHFIKNGAVP